MHLEIHVLRKVRRFASVSTIKSSRLKQIFELFVRHVSPNALVRSWQFDQIVINFGCCRLFGWNNPPRASLKQETINPHVRIIEHAFCFCKQEAVNEEACQPTAINYYGDMKPNRLVWALVF